MEIHGNSIMNCARKFGRGENEGEKHTSHLLRAAPEAGLRRGGRAGVHLSWLFAEQLREKGGGTSSSRSFFSVYFLILLKV